MPTITYLTTIQFDFGAVKLLGGETKAVGISRPLVVTDKGVAACGVLDKVLEHLPDAMQVSIFDGTPENPTEAAVLRALAQYRANDCDGLIAVGGGSPMDLAKGVAILTAHEPPLEQYAAIFGGAAKITDKVAPVIAVPTTAGTGSEVGRGAILTLNDGRKLGFSSPNNIPRRAICDPELTLGLPDRLTAATGMDAVAHCYRRAAPRHRVYRARGKGRRRPRGSLGDDDGGDDGRNGVSKRLGRRSRHIASARWITGTAPSSRYFECGRDARGPAL